MSRIAVIGGGIAGLSACHYIRKFIPSAQVSLFERNSNYGGWINTLKIPITSNMTVPIEIGPNSIRGGNNEKTLITSQLINELNLSNDIQFPSETAKQRFIYYNNKIHPMNKLAFKCVISAMSWIPYYQFYYYLKGGHENRYNDESIYDFFNRNFGQTVTNVLASSFVSGVYGGGINQLSIKSSSPFNVIKEMEMEHGSYFVGGIKKVLQRKSNPQISEKTTDNNIDLTKVGSFTFNYGLKQLIDSLINNCMNDNNISLYDNFNINSIYYSSNKECVTLIDKENKEFDFDYIINAVQPKNCMSFLESTTYDLNDFNLSSSLITVNMIFKNKQFVEMIHDKFEGFGILIPRECENINDFNYNENNLLLGIIYYSSIFSFSNDNDNENDILSLVVMFGGPNFDTNSMATNQIVNLCKTKLKEMYDIDIDENNQKEIICDNKNNNEILEIFNVNNNNYMNSDIVYNINRLEKAIEHYKVGHSEKLESLRNQLSKVYNNKLSIIGSGYDGVSIPDCILSAYKCAENVSQIIHDQNKEQLKL